VVIQMQVHFPVGLAACFLHDRVAQTSPLGARAAAQGLIVLARNVLATGASATLADFELAVDAAFTLARMLFMRYSATLFHIGVWNAPLPRHPTALIAPFASLIPVSRLLSGAQFPLESLVHAQ
jgi:hypothetical protein